MFIYGCQPVTGSKWTRAQSILGGVLSQVCTRQGWRNDFAIERGAIVKMSKNGKFGKSGSYKIPKLFNNYSNTIWILKPYEYNWGNIFKKISKRWTTKANNRYHLKSKWCTKYPRYNDNFVQQHLKKHSHPTQAASAWKQQGLQLSWTDKRLYELLRRLVGTSTRVTENQSDDITTI